MIDPDYILLARLVSAGSIAAAARELRLSPAMASRRLARLEARLGVRLVQRTTRRLALTPAGEQFHADVVAILAAVEAAEARLTGAAAAPAGLLRVTAPTSFGRLHIAPQLHRFLASYPAVTLSFDLSDSFSDLVAEGIDVGVRIAASVPAGLDAHRLGASRRVLCASPSYLERAGTPARIADLREHALLAAEGQLPWRLVSDTRRASVDHASRVGTNSSELVRELALSGVGIALRSLWDVGEALRSGRLVRVLPEWEGTRDVAIWAVHPRAPIVSPAVRAFVAFLREVIDPAAWE
ncbi:transcriptional regulator, LysR family [Sphingomonas palmae]|uniref:Transcriptional regulator, LysR family n=1 Tax=Sphingomonas palmae TaxID=1855283 RepID=A0A1H7UIM2_9SPHN|nr:LysR family transcriptional regulator [Sphingomonas palmae]SEL96117.1 transcriptional regulator, LysR family [Sphingomonas palmae]